MAAQRRARDTPMRSCRLRAGSPPRRGGRAPPDRSRAARGAEPRPTAHAPRCPPRGHARAVESRGAALVVRVAVETRRCALRDFGRRRTSSSRRRWARRRSCGRTAGGGAAADGALARARRAAGAPRPVPSPPRRRPAIGRRSAASTRRSLERSVAAFAAPSALPGGGVVGALRGRGDVRLRSGPASRPVTRARGRRRPPRRRRRRRDGDPSFSARAAARAGGAQRDPRRAGGSAVVIASSRAPCRSRAPRVERRGATGASPGRFIRAAGDHLATPAFSMHPCPAARARRAPRGVPIGEEVTPPSSAMRPPTRWPCMSARAARARRRRAGRVNVV